MYYRRWCERFKRQRFDRPMGSRYRCDTIRETDSINGKPSTFTLCDGPSIDACVESFVRVFPETSNADSFNLELAPEFFSVGYDATISITWGGVQGFRTACNNAGVVASTACTAALSECEEARGCGR